MREPLASLQHADSAKRTFSASKSVHPNPVHTSFDRLLHGNRQEQKGAAGLGHVHRINTRDTFTVHTSNMHTSQLHIGIYEDMILGAYATIYAAKSIEKHAIKKQHRLAAVVRCMAGSFYNARTSDDSLCNEHVLQLTLLGREAAGLSRVCR